MDGSTSLVEFAMGFLVLVTTWQIWAGVLVLVGAVSALMLACAREEGVEELSDDGSDRHGVSFGGDQGASDE